MTGRTLPPEARAQASEGRHARFRPGDVLASRYRIVELVGRGGMGEVYHADDLTLDQPVALKLVPERLARDPGRLAGLKREVRLARQISHPNVCRVYDIGEADGLVFLSMEFIRGEDLRSLLQRIGRLSPDKAAQAAREISAGVGAAHEKGILHRDLKPANVMLDEQGRARIMDFGLAAVTGTIEGEEIRGGTPAYMAPEQRAGREVTERSDIYSLGLVLYELFTGTRAFPPTGETAPTRPPSAVVEGLDPSIDRIILRCLEPEPRDRPASALVVRRAFPGEDLLTRAVARGETPARDLVAEAGDFAGLRPVVAWACLAGLVLALLGTVGLRGRSRLPGIVPLPKSPEVLAADARTILEALGYPTPQRDATRGFSLDTAYLEYLAAMRPVARWREPLARGEPSVIRFWYRESPAFLVPHRSTEFFASPSDPPLTVPGMASVELDPRGRLRRLEVVPFGRDHAGPATREPDWDALFAQARLERSKFTAVAPEWRPPVFADRRAAWEGVYPDAPEVGIRVEAASLAGQPVSFLIREPWSAPGAGDGRAGWVRPWNAVEQNWVRVAHIAFHFSLLVGLGLLARRNLRSGRGDRKLAFRLACALFALVMLQWVLAAHHVPERSEFDLFFGALYRAFFAFGLGWLFYIVLEPYARRLWPRALTSWVRLLDGRFRDPLLGRDVLAGCVSAGAFSLLWAAAWDAVSRGGPGTPSWIAGAWSRPDLPRHPATLLALAGIRTSLAEVIAVQVNITTHVLFLFVALLLLRFLLRRTPLAVAFHWAAYVLVYAPTFGLVPIVAWITAWHVLFFRFGWVAILVSTFLADLLAGFPLTSDLSSWTAHATVIPLSVCLGLAVYGFRVSLGERPLFRDLLGEK